MRRGVITKDCIHTPPDGKYLLNSSSKLVYFIHKTRAAEYTFFLPHNIKPLQTTPNALKRGVVFASDSPDKKNNS